VNPARNRSSLIYLLLFVAIIAMVVFNFNQQASAQEVLTINEVASEIQRGNVERITEDDNRLRVIFNDGVEKSSHKETGATLVEQLKELGVTTEQLSAEAVKLEIKAPSAILGVATALGYILPFFLVRFSASARQQQCCTFLW
jgi:ATP-dependent Zn protease